MEEEVWRDVPGYNGRYQVSNTGNVKSLIGKEKTLTPKKQYNGQAVITLTNNYQRGFFSIARLVALAFVDNPEKKDDVVFKNGNKSDHRIENLMWATRAELIENSSLHSDMKFSRVLNKEQVQELFKMFSTGKYTLKELGFKFQTSEASVSKIITKMLSDKKNNR